MAPNWPLPKAHISALGLMLLMLNLSACMPLPNYAYISPIVIGKAHRGGTPIPNAVVSIEHPRDEHCSYKSDVATRTNTAGEFRLEARKQFELFVFMDPFHNWQVCIVDGDRFYQGWYQRGLGRLAGIWRSAPEVTLDCNLESTPHLTQIGNTLGKTMGVCSATWTYN
jgi:hypothetical protein